MKIEGGGEGNGKGKELAMLRTEKSLKEGRAEVTAMVYIVQCDTIP